MAANSRPSTELLLPKRWQDREKNSPERTKVWTEPRSKSSDRKVPVIYYLSRNGHIEHPHFVEVPLSSSKGLHLRDERWSLTRIHEPTSQTITPLRNKLCTMITMRAQVNELGSGRRSVNYSFRPVSMALNKFLFFLDVLKRLNFLRGKGMSDMYSWSSKRSYRSGYVWHDLTEDDLIRPTNGHEYVLKGSELHQSSLSITPREKVSPQNLLEASTPSEHTGDIAAVFKRNQSWSSFDNPPEYRVYRSESSRGFAGVAAADAATQTDEKGRRRRANVRSEEVEKQSEELISRGELSPPLSNASSVGMDGVSGSRGVEHSAAIRDRTVSDQHPSGRMKVLMQLITCGSVNDLGAMKSSEDLGCVVGVNYGRRVPRESLDR
ncbi:hypothetical protein RJ639_038653 [Escallonia herrerae]|uniref:SOSEKI DIX-like domain-containing protein n=1 Tax=Escallonia herrerae TaxID=1293975 RepID=A0AA88WJA2_9ASTE|nr:hypothetical protein RJ639_038653 [Escallonia herrerae]